jgi:hypothetical protein
MSALTIVSDLEELEEATPHLGVRLPGRRPRELLV